MKKRLELFNLAVLLFRPARHGRRNAINLDAYPLDQHCALDLNKLLVVVNRAVGQDRGKAHLGVMRKRRRASPAINEHERRAICTDEPVESGQSLLAMIKRDRRHGAFQNNVVLFIINNMWCA